MMKVTYRLKLGQDEFELQAEVKDEKQFFETMSFYSNLPKAAPGGATDLKLVFRTTKKGHKYYSLISEQEQMEFKLGQNLDANGGGLFCKGWEKAYGADEEGEQAPQQTQSNAAPIGVGAKPAAAAAPKAAAPKVTAPIIKPAATAAVAKPAVAPAIPTPAAIPEDAVQAQPAQVATPTPAAAAPAGQNPQVTAVAANVLSRFGIKK